MFEKAGISIFSCITKSYIWLNNVAKADMIIPMVISICSRFGSFLINSIIKPIHRMFPSFRHYL